MILVKLTDKDSNEYYISDAGIIADNKFWKPKLSELSSIQMRPDHEYGGMVRIQGYGSLSFMPDTVPWPPPIKLEIEVKYIDEQENIFSLFNATGYIKNVGQDQITYNLYNPEYEVDLLDKEYSEYGSGFSASYTVSSGVINSVTIIDGGTGYTSGIIEIVSDGWGSGFRGEFTSTDGVVDSITIIDGGSGYPTGAPVKALEETGRVYPLAIGTISMELPMELGEDYEYTYYKAGITGTNPTEEIGDYQVYDDGRQKDKYDGSNTKGTIIDCTYRSVSDMVIIDGGTNYSTGSIELSPVPGAHGSGFSAYYTSTLGIIDNIIITNAGSGYETQSVTITITDDNESWSGTPAQLSYSVYADYNHPNTFRSIIYNNASRFNKPYGDIRFSGTNENIKTLKELFEWAVSRFSLLTGITYTLDHSVSRNPSPSVNFYVNKQYQLLDFLSDVSAYCSHCFYIDEDECKFHLVDMFQDNGETDLSFGLNNEVTLFFDAEYTYPDPIKYLEIKWDYFEPGFDQHDYPIFVQKDFMYSLDFGNQFGVEENIHCFNRVNEDVEPGEEVFEAVSNIGKLLKEPDVEIEIPFDLDVVVPGKRYNFMDSKTYFKSSVSVRIHTIEYSPLDLTTKVIGKFIPAE